MLKTNSSCAPDLPFLARRRAVVVGDLTPCPGGMAAFVLWGSLPRRRLGGELVVQRADQGWRWCGGFEGLPGPGDETVMVRILARRASMDMIREAMWAEAISSAGLSPRNIPLWAELVRRHLPEDMMRFFFGVRGLNASSAARIFGVTRQTMARYLGPRHD